MDLRRHAEELLRLGRLEEALLASTQAVSRLRQLDIAHGVHAVILTRLHRNSEAIAALASAQTLADGSAEAYDSVAYASLQLGLPEQASRLYSRAILLSPRVATYLFNAASCERSIGHLAEAEALCDRSIDLDPHLYSAYLLRSELRRQSPERNHVAALRRQMRDRACTSRGRVTLGYALAKELDDLGRIDEAFSSWAMAAALRRRSINYQVQDDVRKLQRIREEFGAQVPNNEASDSDQFAFVIGLPRSGTTLVERILTGHPTVRPNGETNNFLEALIRHTPSGTGDIFSRASQADFASAARTYRSLAIHTSDSSLTIEKLPLNYLYVGAIRNALPKARIILVLRSPIDSCFAMFRTLFADAYPFSYDLNELAAYHSAFQELVNHWLRIFGQTLHVVYYEDLVQRPQETGRTIAEYCGIEWRDEFLSVERNLSASYTASAVQARAPIHTMSVQKWKAYEKHLQPLISQLPLAIASPV